MLDASRRALDVDAALRSWRRARALDAAIDVLALPEWGLRGPTLDTSFRASTGDSAMSGRTGIGRRRARPARAPA